MLGTKTKARKSLGGRPPKKLKPGPHPRYFKDHTGRTYNVLTSGRHHGLDKLGVQLYCLGSPSPSAEVLGDKFLWCDAIKANNDYCPRVDIYNGFGSVEECIEHHRREKEFRKQAIKEMHQNAVAGLSEEGADEKLITEIRGQEPLPHIVPSWCPSEQFWNPNAYWCSRYRSWIFVMPESCTSWEDVEEKGLLHVSFDLDVTPAMETTADNWVEEDTLLENDKQGWVYVERTLEELQEPVRRRLLCVREPPRRGFFEPSEPEENWKTPNTERRLYHVWSDATMSLCCCAYRGLDCEDCWYDTPHERCEIELSECYHDDDGQSIVCRRQKEYRRRSKRIAARQGKNWA